MAKTFEQQLVGKRVQMWGKHPWRPHAGTIVRIGNTVLGSRPVVKLDDMDQECFAMEPSDFRYIDW